MEMCPYCGEEVPQDSSKCWKCGTELSEGSSAKAEGDELEVPEDEDEDGAPAAKGTIECPFCGSPVPKKAIRCRECGRTVQKIKTNTTAVMIWKWGVWAIVLIVAISATSAVVMYSKKRAGEEDRARNAIGATFEQLVQHIQPLSRGFKEERRKEVWEKDFHNRFVHWSDGVVTQKPTDATVRVKQSKTTGGCDCLVTFADEAEATSLNVDQTIEYSARLVSYGGDEGVAFVLDKARLEKK